MTLKNHYIIGRTHGPEGQEILFLGRVLSADGNVVSGYKEKDCHLKDKRQHFEVHTKDVCLDLGTDPYPGTVHKFETTRLYSGQRTLHDFWGSIYFFYKIDAQVKTGLLSAFDRAQSIIEKLKLPSPDGTYWSILSAKTKGKHAGMYIHSGNTNKHPHRFEIKPEHMPSSPRYFLYVILHEYAHWLERNCMLRPKLRAKWIRLFNTSIKPQTITKDMSQALLEKLVSGGERPSDFRGQLEEDERNAFNWIIRAIGQEHAVAIRDLDTLFEAEDRDEITSLWPRHVLKKKDLKPIVSDYATKNWHELWAEAFSLRYSKLEPVSDGICTAIDKTLRVLDAPQEPDQREGDEE